MEYIINKKFYFVLLILIIFNTSFSHVLNNLDTKSNLFFLTGVGFNRGNTFYLEAEHINNNFSQSYFIGIGFGLINSGMGLSFYSFDKKIKFEISKAFIKFYYKTLLWHKYIATIQYKHKLNNEPLSMSFGLQYINMIEDYHNYELLLYFSLEYRLN